MSEHAWHTLSAEACANALQVDVATGLSSTEAAARLKVYGPNAFKEAKKESRWHAFLRQYKDLMQVVLVGAGVVSLLIAQTGTGVLLIALSLLNAFLGIRQEAKAAASVAALNQMMKKTVQVRRDGKAQGVDIEALVPGDVALLREGDRVPADGRLVTASNLQTDESTLTGESTLSIKDTKAVSDPKAGLGDRSAMVFMNTNVARGRASFVVCATGMQTQVGNIASMMHAAPTGKSPLTKQIDQLTRIILILGAVAFAAIVIMGLQNDEPFAKLFNTGVAMAVGAIPSGLPAVLTTILALGTVSMAKQHAIVKSLPSVETLGSTSAICTDKTGTLTLNQMTVVSLDVPGAQYAVTGEGYVPNGQINHAGGQANPNLDQVLLPMVLCSDATIKDGKCVGDPNEGALLVLAAKGGVDADLSRARYPRLATLPFDSSYMMMATFHEFEAEPGKKVVRCFVKGAPDKVLQRVTTGRRWDGVDVSIAGHYRTLIDQEMERLAKAGQRELIFAERDFNPATFDAQAPDLLALLKDLRVTALVGMLDPPRPEAKEAIARCKAAGIRVRMITGDLALTAKTVAADLGITGEVITGSEFEAMSDAEVDGRIGQIGVIARVAPQDKVRLVKILQRRGEIVAMTGDGVNDAPALKTADIGVVMGITGTDVAKDAAVMILTDDNFATIVSAVEQGRGVYDNLMKFIRLQMIDLVGFILGFLGAAATFGATFMNPLQVLWVNFADLAPMGAAMALDSPTPGMMSRAPRPAAQPIIGLKSAIQLAVGGILLASSSLYAYGWALHTTNSAVVAQTLALAVFSIGHIASALNIRFPEQSIFHRETLSNPKLWLSFLWCVVGTILVTELPLLQSFFVLAPLNKAQWQMCFGLVLLILLVGEVVKWILHFWPERKAVGVRPPAPSLQT